MRKKILIVNFRDIYGGGEVYLTNLILQLNHSGKFEIFSISPNNQSYISSIKKVCTQIFIGRTRARKFLSLQNFYNYLSEARQINNIVKKNNIDIIYLNGASGLYLAPLLSRKAKIFAIKHMLLEGGQITLKKWLHKISIKRLEKLIVISNLHKKQLNSHFNGRFNNKIEVVYNGVDEMRFVNNPDRKQKEDQNLIILEIARLTQVKGQNILIESFEKLKSRYSNIQLWLAGIGPQINSLEAIVETKNLSNSVKFLGFIEDTPNLIQSADIIVLPSFNEGLPLSLIEGMAMGKPLISTNIAGIPELIEEGSNGLLIAPGDANELTNALEKLIISKEVREKMGEKGRQMFLAKFTLRITTKKLIDIFLSQNKI